MPLNPWVAMPLIFTSWFKLISMKVLWEFLLEGEHHAKELFKRANSAFRLAFFPFPIIRCSKCDEDESWEFKILPSCKPRGLLHSVRKKQYKIGFHCKTAVNSCHMTLWIKRNMVMRWQRPLTCSCSLKFNYQWQDASGSIVPQRNAGSYPIIFFIIAWRYVKHYTFIWSDMPMLLDLGLVTCNLQLIQNLGYFQYTLASHHDLYGHTLNGQYTHCLQF